MPRIEFAGEFDRAEQHAATAGFHLGAGPGHCRLPDLLAERNGQLAC
jgi:putative protein-disulfide isomerase